MAGHEASGRTQGKLPDMRQVAGNGWTRGKAGIKAKGMWNGVQVGGTGKIGDVYLVICEQIVFCATDVRSECMIGCGEVSQEISAAV